MSQLDGWTICMLAWMCVCAICAIVAIVDEVIAKMNNANPAIHPPGCSAAEPR